MSESLGHTNPGDDYSATSKYPFMPARQLTQMDRPTKYINISSTPISQKMDSSILSSQRQTMQLLDREQSNEFSFNHGNESGVLMEEIGGYRTNNFDRSLNSFIKKQSIDNAS